MAKGSFYIEEEEEEEEEETESDDDDESGVGVEEESEEEIRERSKRIMIRLVSGRSGGREIESESFGGCGGGGSICCQADECSVNLSLAKKYYRRHKVCERHAKAAVVLVAGVRQRFCQQCSRFHEILQFDHNKRSCRKRLAGHNERRRKASSELPEEEPPSMPEMNCATRHHSYSVSNRSANEGNWRCLSIMADERSRATGFAFFCSDSFSLPTFPAEAPCSKTA